MIGIGSARVCVRMCAGARLCARARVCAGVRVRVRARASRRACCWGGAACGVAAHWHAPMPRRAPLLRLAPNVGAGPRQGARPRARAHAPPVAAQPNPRRRSHPPGQLLQSRQPSKPWGPTGQLPMGYVEPRRQQDAPVRGCLYVTRAQRDIQPMPRELRWRIASASGACALDGCGARCGLHTVCATGTCLRQGVKQPGA